MFAESVVCVWQLWWNWIGNLDSNEKGWRKEINCAQLSQISEICKSGEDWGEGNFGIKERDQDVIQEYSAWSYFANPTKMAIIYISQRSTLHPWWITGDEHKKYSATTNTEPWRHWKSYTRSHMHQNHLKPPIPFSITMIITSRATRTRWVFAFLKLLDLQIFFNLHTPEYYI